MKAKETPSGGLLAMAGMKKTDARIAVLDLLSAAKKLVTSRSVYANITSLGIDKVTVYRTLAALEEAGLIKRVELGGHDTKYEIVDVHDDHHHVICLKCKKTNDFVGCDAGHLIKKALGQAKDFNSVLRHSFDFFGVCNACSKKKR